MFDWIPNLYASLSLTFFIGYLIGIGVGIPFGIGLWMHRIDKQEARQLAKEIEARIAQCPDEIEQEEVEEVWVRLLKSCDL